jgi:hypothetical protein
MFKKKISIATNNAIILSKIKTFLTIIMTFKANTFFIKKSKGTFRKALRKIKIILEKKKKDIKNFKKSFFFFYKIVQLKILL